MTSGGRLAPLEWSAATRCEPAPCSLCAGSMSEVVCSVSPRQAEQSDA
eukprot:CAMPEP_0114108810 /NCGR_PEP_ID=MMETSP0043_2-20121206/427_1 /TAXON_ID=464988 /ORGANISM="Hemiselmis andersenii, Strain CCMP644" /LENGTH=47 /DNA_ID= /DNA_START= /DNA_END= /DNA_ORIENTATION=